MIRLVKFGQGGDTVFDDDGSTTSGYGSPERPHAAAGKDVPDGTPALDLRAAVDTELGFSWVFKGPMVNPKLQDGARADCPEPTVAMMGAGGLQGSFLSAAGLHLAHRRAGRPEPAPLDEVSVAEYVRGWREHGARVGEYRGGFIVWEDEHAPPAGWDRV